MKKIKFFAMLLAAFSLSFAFSACGDDDDEPTPDNSPAKQNELKIGGLSVTFVTAEAFGMDGQIELMFQSAENQNVAGSMMINFDCLSLMNGNIPTGSYPMGTYLEQAPCYSSVSGGIMSREEGNEVWFEAVEGSSPIKVEHSGNTYTISIPSLKVRYHSPDGEKDATISFTYKGAINCQSHNW